MTRKYKTKLTAEEMREKNSRAGKISAKTRKKCPLCGKKLSTG